IADARVDLAAMPQTDGQLQLPFIDEAGLVDPDAAIAFLFAGTKQLMATLNAREVDRIAFENVEIVSGTGDAAHLLVRSAAVSRKQGRQLSLAASVELGGRSATIEGTAELDAP